jgi:hypothetical protein
MENLFVKIESLNYTFTQIDLSEKTFYRQVLFTLSMQMSHPFIAQRSNKTTKKNKMT